MKPKGTDTELAYLHVWAKMYKEGLCYPYFDSINGMRRCIFEATSLPSPVPRAVEIHGELQRRFVLKRMTDASS